MLTANLSRSQDKTPTVAGREKPAASPRGEETGTASERAIQAKLDQRADLEFVGAPLSEVVQRLSETHKVQIVLNHRKLQEDANVTGETRVTATGRGLTLGRALRSALQELNVDFVIRNEVLEITSTEDAETYLVIRTYAAADLFDVRPRSDHDQPDFAALEDLVKNAIAPESWRDAGGSGTASFAKGVLVITQSQSNHEIIARFLAKLRQARRQISEAKADARLTPINCEPAAEANARIYEKLGRAISINWSETFLEDCAKQLARELDVPVRLLTAKLADVNVTPETPVTLKLSSVSARGVLNHVASILNAGWIVRDGVLLITSPEEVSSDLTARIYPIPDLIPSEDDVETGAAVDMVINNTVKPDSWKDAGGAGVIIRCDSPASLICLQARPVHEEIENVLANLRKDLASSAEAPRAAPRMPVRVYRLVDAGPAAGRTAAEGAKASTQKPDGGAASDIAKLVKELVAPESWEAPGSKAYVRPLGNRLIVRQSLKAHREIRDLLQKLGSLDDAQPPTGGFF